jgi:hypothetical protein
MRSEPAATEHNFTVQYWNAVSLYTPYQHTARRTAFKPGKSSPTCFTTAVIRWTEGARSVPYTLNRNCCDVKPYAWQPKTHQLISSRIISSTCQHSTHMLQHTRRQLTRRGKAMSMPSGFQSTTGPAGHDEKSAEVPTPQHMQLLTLCTRPYIRS